MRKFIMILAAVAAVALTVVSCKEEAKFGVVYNVEVQAEGDGQFDVAYPGGYTKLSAAGDAVSVFTNDTTAAPLGLVVEGVEVLSLADALQSEDAAVAEAAAQTNAWLEDNFTATVIDGTYYVHLMGYVKETLTGLTFSIDKELTNRK